MLNLRCAKRVIPTSTSIDGSCLLAGTHGITVGNRAATCDVTGVVSMAKIAWHAMPSLGACAYTARILEPFQSRLPLSSSPLTTGHSKRLEVNQRECSTQLLVVLPCKNHKYYDVIAAAL